MTARALAVVLCLLLTACASIPDVTVTYYFPRAETQFTVTQTIGCTPKPDPKVKNPDSRHIRSVISVAVATTNSADLDWMNDDPRTKQPTTTHHQGHILYKALNGTFTDADATVTLTPDGRLSGINATSAGQGDAIVKNLITVAGVVAVAFAKARDPVVDQACDKVDQYSAIMQAGTLDLSKPVPSLVTLTYSVAVRYNIDSSGNPTLKIDQALSPGYSNQTGQLTTLTFFPDAPSGPAHKDLHDILGGKMDIQLEISSQPPPNPRYLETTSTAERINTLELTKVALVSLDVTGYVADLEKKTQIWSAPIPVPTRQSYFLPIPSPPTFGKTAFGISLSDYGSVTSIHYGSTNGGPDLSDAAGNIATALKPKSTGDRAKEIQDQADLIAQQQRLIVCQTTPTQCK